MMCLLVVVGVRARVKVARGSLLTCSRSVSHPPHLPSLFSSLDLERVNQIQMATSGLSRRRAGGGGGARSGAGANSPNGGLNSPTLGAGGPLSGSSSRPTTPASSTQSGLAGGGIPSHKVAYDERDMESSEDRIMPKLTLMEEILLLGLKDKQVSPALSFTPRL